MTDTTQVIAPNGSQRAILTISLSKFLGGHDIAEVLRQDWSTKATLEQQQAFHNEGFNLDPTNSENTLKELEEKLGEKRWDAVIVGWCSRGNTKFTPLFEKIVAACLQAAILRETEDKDKGYDRLKILFSDGPQDLVNTTLRGFGGD